ncbi:MAG: response regulator [Nitrospirota bacterium]
MPTARILSIDDSPTVLKLIEMICQNVGYEIHLARNGREGVERAIQVHPDVILVDFIMPEMNGLQVCKALQENPTTREIPIILVSSKGEAVGDKFVETLGVKHYCTKPFQADDLLAKLAEVLGEAAVPPPAEQPASASAAAGEPPAAARKGASTVLSIDDSPTILRLVEMILSHAGYDVHTAADGSAGVAMAKELHPDIVLVDFIMPGMNGFQVCKALRDDPDTAAIPIVLVSSKGEAIGEQFVETLKIEHYLTKPFQPEELVAEVQRILGTDGSHAARGEESVPPESRDIEAPLGTNADYQAVALRSLLEAELAAMEGRLIAHINAKLNEVLEEIRSSGRVPTTS